MSNIHFWVPKIDGFGGGIANLNREMLNTLKKAYGKKLNISIISKLDSSGSYNGLPIKGSLFIHPRLRTIHYAFLLLCNAFLCKPKLIICSHVNFSPIAFLLKRILGINYVILTYGIEVRAKVSWIQLRALNESVRIFTISEWTSDRLQKLGLDKSKITKMPVPIHEEKFVIDKKNLELLEFYGIDANSKIILTAGRLDAAECYKGHDRVIRALPAVLRKIPTVHYMIVGSGDDIDRLQRLAIEMKLEEYITFCGFVPDHQLQSHYSSADLFVMPSTGEGFGIVFLEAMLSGIPVMGGSIDGSAEPLMSGKFGKLVDPNSLMEIADGIVKMLEGEGPASYFNKQTLRSNCVRNFGLEVFQNFLTSEFDELSRSVGLYE